MSGQVAEEVVAVYATSLFIRSEAKIRRPIVLLTGEPMNVYGVLEKHFRETALPPPDRFWRIVRTQWTPQLDTWRPRVNGVQLKVLAGARLPESDEEWVALRQALRAMHQHLRPNTSVDGLLAELRDFVGTVVDWWHKRKKAGDEAGSLTGRALVKRVASSGLLLGSGVDMPLDKRQCLDAYLQPQQTAAYRLPKYAGPEIVQHPLLGGAGSGRLPELAPPAPAPPQPPPHIAELHDGSVHGGKGFMHHLTNNDNMQLYGQLFPGNPGGLAGDDMSSPADEMQQHGSTPLDGYQARSPDRGAGEGFADNREPVGRVNSIESKCCVTLNVGGYRFHTTAATLAAVPGSYFAKLAHQAVGAAAKGQTSSEFFVDRNGKVFEYVLDYLRSQRFYESSSSLPQERRTLHLLVREADFYLLPSLADRARAALALATQHAGEMLSDVPGYGRAEGSSHGGQLALAQLGGGGGSHGSEPLDAAGAALEAIFLETGFLEAAELPVAQASLLRQLNSLLATKQADGFALLSCECGTEREHSRRNLHYHALLRKTTGAAEVPTAAE